MAKQKKAQEVSAVRQAKHGWIITLLFTVLSVLWISPILMVLLNSFKRKAYIFKHPFGISTVSITEGFEAFKDGMSRLFSGTLNYKNGLRMTHFWDCFGNSLFITVGSVVLIVLCCSMCAWYIVRVKTKGTKLMYTLCLFSMIVPFQMVMFTLSIMAASSISNEMLFTNPVNINTASPTAVTVAILEAMWVWNDYLLPSLVLNINQYKTIPIAIQYLKQSHGMIDWGAMMAMLVLAILPIVIFYIACQKYIIEGVLAGAVKG